MQCNNPEKETSTINHKHKAVKYSSRSQEETADIGERKKHSEYLETKHVFSHSLFIV